MKSPPAAHDWAMTVRDLGGLIFDDVPSLYDRYRPGYPDRAVAALVELAHLRDGSKVLEVGAGTGQLTTALVDRGLIVTALEPGARMGALLRRKLAPFPSASVVGSRLEDVARFDMPFDAVISATAFHWVDPDQRYVLAAQVLRHRGSLALIRNDHALSTESWAYYRGVAPIYERLAPEMGPPYVPPPEDEIPGLRDEMVASGVFELVGEQQFAWNEEYTASALIGLLRTYSQHRWLPAARRRALLGEIRRFVEVELGDCFVDQYVTTVCVGRKRA
jgi:SAM-dependent methyltransferase